MSVTGPEIYISVDVETSGPIPGEYSLLSIGACLIINPAIRFYTEIKPISKKAVPAAMAVSHLSLKKLRLEGVSPAKAMVDFDEWIGSNSRLGTPVLVGFNACFDWSFINWYFHKFMARNPFGIGAIDIKAYYMGRAKCSWHETAAGHLPETLKSTRSHTHNALDDALEQAEIFRKLLALSRGRPYKT
jgi:DNA polymerase III epsilon subunit-like protein